MFAALVLVSGLFPASDAHAFGDCDTALSRLRLYEVEEARTIEPERIAAREILGPQPMPGPRHARSGRSAERAHHATAIARRIDRLWRIRVPRAVMPGQLVVTHRVAGQRASAIQHEQGDAALGVRIRPVPPSVVCRNASDHIIEGGAELTIQFPRLPLAGVYLGTIETDVRAP